MVLEFLFAAGVGAAITGAVSQKLDQAKSRRMESLFEKAKEYHQQVRPRQTISVLEEAMKIDRFDPRIYVLMWHAYTNLAITQEDKAAQVEAIDNAMQCYQVLQWLAGQGVFIPSEILEEYEKQIVHLKTLRDIATGKVQVQSKKGEEYERKCDSAMQANDFKKALVYINKAIEVETGDLIIAGYHVKRAIAKEVLGDYAGAVRDCNMALTCEGLSDEVREIAAGIRNSAKADQYAHKAQTAVDAGNHRKALEYITNAIDSRTNDGVVAVYHMQRAGIRETLGDYGGALDDCDIVLRCQELNNKQKEIARGFRRFLKSKQQAEKKPSKPAAQRTRTSAKARTGRTRKGATQSDG